MALQQGYGFRNATSSRPFAAKLQNYFGEASRWF
jgi:hypothetical protein